MGLTRTIYYLKVSGVYGHTIVNIGAPTVSFGVGLDSVAISFTGGLNTENLGIKKYRLYTDGKKAPFEAWYYWMTSEKSVHTANQRQAKLLADI